MKDEEIARVISGVGEEAATSDSQREVRAAHDSQRQEFSTGAARSRLQGRRDLIPQSAIDAIGRRLAIGAERYGENNWRLGGEDFRKATINHLLNHLADYMENGNATEENTDAIICNAAFLCQYELDAPYGGAKGAVETLLRKKTEPARLPVVVPEEDTENGKVYVHIEPDNVYAYIEGHGTYQDEAGSRLLTRVATAMGWKWACRRRTNADDVSVVTTELSI